jgi:hypothetical protein
VERRNNPLRGRATAGFRIKRHATDYSAIIVVAENIQGVKSVVDHLRPLGAVLL